MKLLLLIRLSLRWVICAKNRVKNSYLLFVVALFSVYIHVCFLLWGKMLRRNRDLMSMRCKSIKLCRIRAIKIENFLSWLGKMMGWLIANIPKGYMMLFLEKNKCLSLKARIILKDLLKFLIKLLNLLKKSLELIAKEK